MTHPTHPRCQFTVGRLLGSMTLLCTALGMLSFFVGPDGIKGLLIPTIVTFVAAGGQLFGRPVLAVVMTAMVGYLALAVMLILGVLGVFVGFD